MGKLLSKRKRQSAKEMIKKGKHRVEVQPGSSSGLGRTVTRSPVHRRAIPRPHEDQQEDLNLATVSHLPINIVRQMGPDPISEELSDQEDANLATVPHEQINAPHHMQPMLEEGHEANLVPVASGSQWVSGGTERLRRDEESAVDQGAVCNHR